MSDSEPSAATADSLASGTPFMAALLRESRIQAEEYRANDRWSDALSGAFLSFLRATARFDVFSFGPINIYVPAVRAAMERAVEEGRDLGGDYTPFTVLAEKERRRAGASELSELHMLLAFMKLGDGLPGLVFGELGVSPEAVEEFARSGGVQQGDLERLYSAEEAAKYLNVHVETIRDWIRTGHLKASRLAGRRALRIKASDLAAVLEPIEPTAPTEDT